MVASIDKLKSAVSNIGFARANRYNVILPKTSFGEGLNILCDTVTWPGRQITTGDYYTSMRNSPIAYAFGVGNITVGFYLTNDWKSWDYLNAWQNQILTKLNDGGKGFKVNFKKDYKGDITIEHLNSEDKPTKVITIFNAFPTTLSPIELGNGSEEIIKVSAEFAFDNWRVTNPGTPVSTSSRPFTIPPILQTFI